MLDMSAAITDSFKLIRSHNIRLGEELEQINHQINNSLTWILYSYIASLHSPVTQHSCVNNNYILYSNYYQLTIQ